MMLINSFSSIVQLGITLSIGFIAVEAVKTFTQVLSERLFRFEAFIEKEFGLCKKALLDGATVNAIRPAEVNGKSTTNKLEQQKREHERLLAEIDKGIQTSKEEVCAHCQARSMSALCSYHAFIGGLTLLLGAIEGRYPIFAFQALMFASVGGVIYSALGWLLGERTFKSKLLSFFSLTHALSCALLTTVVSTIVALIDHFLLGDLLYQKLSSVQFWLLLIISLLPYLNFAIYGFKIRLKASGVKAQVISKRDELKQECESNTKELRTYQAMGEFNTLSVRAGREDAASPS